VRAPLELVVSGFLKSAASCQFCARCVQGEVLEKKNSSPACSRPPRESRAQETHGIGHGQEQSARSCCCDVVDQVAEEKILRIFLRARSPPRREAGDVGISGVGSPRPPLEPVVARFLKSFLPNLCTEWAACVQGALQEEKKIPLLTSS
jgi:hypothetical protein